ncbi:MAG TPA: heavy metal translocating P-type ATPase [Thermoanaerobaculia bacterium]|nr:heavy metal translocating P-type ATPase [Thermoanaerobaculia bacterium]
MTTKDPVCGMTVDPAHAAGSSDYHGETIYFCSVGCKAKFDANPEKYVGDAPQQTAVHEHAHHQHHDQHAQEHAATAKQWTCPMHPEIVSDRPGACPICGMALEPMTASLDDAPNEELIDMRRRFVISAILSVPLLAIGMTEMFRSFHTTWLPWLELALATPVVLWGGWPFFQRGWMSLVTRNLNMFTLIALGTGASYAYSVAATLAPGLFPASFKEHGMLPLYFEPAAVITTLVLLGQVLELRARERTSGAIKALLGLTPKSARVVMNDGSEHDLPIEQITAGMKVRLRPGERLPVDGVVVEGSGIVDESMLTGEPIPVEKQAGSKVTAGTINNNGAFVMRAEKVGADTLLAHIVRMVAEAQRSRAPIQQLADRVSAWFVPAVIAVAVLTFAAWALIGPEPRFTHALLNAVAVLIIACPCALGLATPMSVMVATGKGATAGILIKNAEELEHFAQVDTLVVDKTGTITEGKPKLVAIETVGGFDEKRLLAMIASVERASEHPLANAIVAAATEQRVAIGKAEEVRTIPGKGVTGTVGGYEIAIGNRALVENAGELESRAEAHRRKGATVMFVAIDGNAVGLVAVADPVKATSAEALNELRARGMTVTMLTGDARATAEAVAHSLGITSIEAEVLPDQKESIVRKLQDEGKVVAMAGDGVNDAPALSRAHVGIAMGTGTDVAIESAGLTLVKGDLRGIVRARNLSEAMMRNIRQNLFFAFFYNLLGVPIAAGILYPFFGVLLSPMIASAAMTFSSVTVIANALRLRNVKL